MRGDLLFNVERADMEGGPFGIYSTGESKNPMKSFMVVVLVIAVLVALCMFIYNNNGPGKNRISGDVDKLGRDISNTPAADKN